jgi:hypothetical protein
MTAAEMSLHATLQQSLKTVPDGVAAGYVDLNTGTLLGIFAAEGRPQEFLNVMASAVTELFEAPLFKMIDKIWSGQLTEEDLAKDGFGEILLFGKEYTTLLKRCQKHDRHAVIYVSRQQTPPGILLMEVRKSLPAVEESV